jgi:hypothetical protein
MNTAPRMAYTPRWPAARRSRSQAFSAAGRVRCHGPGIPQAPESGLERRRAGALPPRQEPQGEQAPFAFLATYTSRLSALSRGTARPSTSPSPGRSASARGGQARSGSSRSSCRSSAPRNAALAQADGRGGRPWNAGKERVRSGGSCARVGTTCRCGLSGSRNAAHRDRPAGPGQEQGPQVSCRGQFHSVCGLAYRRLSFGPVALHHLERPG